MKKSTFSALAGWNQQQAIAMKQALQKSCPLYKKRQGPLHTNPLFSTYQHWWQLCQNLDWVDDSHILDFFQKNFVVYQMAPEQQGLITGYYSPEIKGSLQPSSKYSVPILGVPENLQLINGKPVKRAENGKVDQFYDDRATINKNFSQGRYQGKTVAWTDSLIHRFFLQIQGSGYLRLEDGRLLYLQTTATNGRPYYSIGRYLKEQKFISKVSMQTIDKWLAEHPGSLASVLNKNPRFVFFRVLTNRSVTGAQGVPLTAQRSAAVDKRFIPLGTPIWLSTELTAPDTPWHQALVAQDTGGAIKGPVRVDIYFGMGAKAKHLAGHQNASGQVFVIVPRTP